MANIPIFTMVILHFYKDQERHLGFMIQILIFKLMQLKVAKFCANRLGYPLVDVELQSGSFFTAFEEAVTTYGK